MRPRRGRSRALRRRTVTRRALWRLHWSAPERGSGTVLAVGVLGAVMLLTAVLLPLFAALVVGQAVQGAADAAALAAADTASGAVAGGPCAASASSSAHKHAPGRPTRPGARATDHVADERDERDGRDE